MFDGGQYHMFVTEEDRDKAVAKATSNGVVIGLIIGWITAIAVFAVIGVYL